MPHEALSAFVSRRGFSTSVETGLAEGDRKGFWCICIINLVDVNTA